MGPTMNPSGAEILRSLSVSVLPFP